ncbi:MAG TPA: hypothetical protein VNM90_01995, partial [Haliangium sp.]|nr:hypothetical protein [Haliangium sp.]
MTPAAASTSAAPAPVRPLAGTDTAMVSAELAVSALAGVQRTPRVAFDGTNFLVVWSGDTPGLATDIYGAIVGQDGTIVVPSFAITAVVRDQLVPDVAFDGSNYLVVWQDARTGFGNDVYGAFVGTDGTVRQTNGFPISSAVNAQETPRVAFDGTSGRYLVVWSDARSGISFDVYGNRIDDEPIMVQLLDGNATAGGLVLSAGANAELTPAVAAGPGLFLVAWTDFRDEQDIYGTRVGALTAGASAVLDPAGRAFATAAGAQNLGDVAHDGVARQFIATWADQRGGSSLDAYGARIDETGALRDGPAGSGGILISTFAGSSASGLDIAVNAGFYLPVWASSENAGDIVAARVLADGTVVD